jgi:mRNA degradation ribonuclease J1/J2
LNLPAKGMIIKMEQARKLPDNQVVILTTGSQGEEAAPWRA